MRNGTILAPLGTIAFRDKIAVLIRRYPTRLQSLSIEGKNVTMFSRKAIYPVLLVAAAGTPYLLMEEDSVSSLTAPLTNAFSISDEQAPVAQPSELGSGLTRSVPSEYRYGPAAQHPELQSMDGLAGAPVRELHEVIRFDISPSWVTARWPRVTTTLSETGMEGLRVPVVTGTRIDDLAGSLTYYFDHHHRVQRLTFEGFTGDDGRLVHLVTGDFGLRQEPTLHAGMYAAWWNAVPTSVLRVTRAPVVTRASPHAQLQVFLELNRPGRQFGLSPTAHEILQKDRATFRW